MTLSMAEITLAMLGGWAVGMVLALAIIWFIEAAKYRSRHDMWPRFF